MNAVFKTCQLLGADRAARMEFARRYSNLRAKTEFAAVGELRRGVMQHDRGVDLIEELLRGVGVFGDDRVGMACAKKRGATKLLLNAPRPAWSTAASARCRERDI